MFSGFFALFSTLLLTGLGVHIASLRAWRMQLLLQHRLHATREADELHVVHTLGEGHGVDKTAFVLAMMVRA